MFQKEAIYIAGPECFYKNGNQLLGAMRMKAEAWGFQVTLPNDNPLDLSHQDLRKNAQEIFDDLETDMNNTTIIIADLEAYRGAEADSGTVYEIGMAYARGARCYGYTRDKRILAAKNQGSSLRDGVVYGENGKVMPYYNLPFSPAVIGSTKIIEGDFDDCLKMVMADIEEEYKENRIIVPGEKRENSPVYEKQDKPLVYLAGTERYEKDARERYAVMADICEKHGLKAVTPLDKVDGEMEADNVYTEAGMLTRRYYQNVFRCDAVIADLNDFRGYEMANDVGFECGMAFQLGKKTYGYMEDTDIMIDRVPNLGKEGEFRDQSGSNVENFDYPVNLMFSCSMEIFKGKFEEIISRAAADLL